MLRERALALAKRGLPVFPCRPRTKLPATANGYKDATIDPDLIERLWQQEPEFNIAIATGPRSHVFVLDVDSTDAEGVLRRLEAEHGELPPTVESITARGRHLYFDWPDQPVRSSVGKVGPGLDIRGEGGYVLAPPSVHPSGRAYSWSVDSAKVFSAAPAWLLAKLAGPNRHGYETTPPAEWRELAKGVSEGTRDCSAAKLAGHLLRRRVDPFVALELLLGWNARCKPPLPEEDIYRIVSSIAGKELRRRRGDG